MITLFKKITVAAVVAMFAQVALAAEYQVTVQGQLAKDIFSASFFGITDPSVPVQVSFIVDDAAVTQLSAGTPVVISSGAGFNARANLVNRTSVRDLVATIGTVSFTEDDLVNTQLGTSAHSYDILLIGELAENGLSDVQFNFNNASGNMQFGIMNCLAACNIENFGSGESYMEGSFAEISGLQVFTQVLTPPPSANELLKDLMISIKNNTSIKPLVKLVLEVPLAITVLALKKGNLVQATNSMKAFIALIKPLVKVGKLSQTLGNQLIADAQEIIDAM